MKDGHEWHDLRKDITDLPHIDDGVLVACQNHCYVVRRGRWLAEHVKENGLSGYVAWKYIDRFRW